MEGLAGLQTNVCIVSPNVCSGAKAQVGAARPEGFEPPTLGLEVSSTDSLDLRFWWETVPDLDSWSLLLLAFFVFSLPRGFFVGFLRP